MVDEIPDVRAAAFLDALLDGSARAAEDAVRAALASGLEPQDVHVHVIAPAMRAVGDLWARDEITVADEHLATAITYRVLNVLSVAAGPPSEPTRQRIMLAALAEERHVVGLQMVADTLSGAGFEVMTLGGDVPLDALAASVARYAPAVLGLSVTMPAGPGLPAAIARLRAVEPDLPILLGGAGVRVGGRELAPARYVGDATQAVGAVEALLRAA